MLLVKKGLVLYYQKKIIEFHKEQKEIEIVLNIRIKISTAIPFKQNRIMKKFLSFKTIVFNEKTQLSF
jgi:hypothetical protein